RSPEQLAVGPGDAAVDLEKPTLELFMGAPAHAARGGIQSKRVFLGRSEERATDLDEARLKPAFLGGVESAEDLQTVHVRGVDLAQRRMALGGEGVVIAGPVARHGSGRLHAHGRARQSQTCQSEANQADAHSVHKSARTRRSRSHRGIQVSAPIITGNTNASNAGLPARTWVATAPPSSPVIRTAPRIALRGIA